MNFPIIKAKDIKAGEKLREAYAVVQRLEESDAPEEVLTRAKAIVKELEAPVTADEDSLDVIRLRVAEADKVISNLVKADAPKNVIAKAQEIRRELADPLDSTEEIRAVAGTALEGLSAGMLGDEFRAYAISSLTGADYDEQLEEERRIEADFFHDNPLVANATLIGASFLPSGLLLKAVGTGKTALQGASRGLALAGGEGAVYGFSEGEGGFKNRLENAATVGVFSGVLGAGVGGLVGRAEGRSLARIEAERAAEQARKEAVKLLNKPNSNHDEVIGAFQKEMDEVALDIMVKEGRDLNGLDYGKALKEASKNTGISINRLRHAESARGRSVINFDNLTAKELRERIGTLADETGFVNGRYRPNQFTAWVDDKLRDVGILSEKQVSKRFGAQMRRTASLMARNHAATENVLAGKNIQAFNKALEDDYAVRMHILNMSNIDVVNPAANIAERAASYRQAKAMLARNYGEDAATGLDATLAKIRANSAQRREFVDSGLPDDPYYFPSLALSKQPNTGFRTASPAKKTNTESYDQKRGQLLDPDQAVDYENPMVVAKDWLRKSDSEIAAAQTLKLENLNIRRQRLQQKAAAGDRRAAKALATFEYRVKRGDALYDTLKKAARQEGADIRTAEKAQDILRSLVVMGSRGPEGWISNLRKAAYMGTIANPYSAVLNLGDVFNSAVNYGAENTLEAVLDTIRKRGVDINVEDLGLAKQVTGEFLREGSSAAQKRFNKMNEAAFKLSGFTDVDRFGKNVALKAAVKQGQELVRKGQLKEKYGHAFTNNEFERLSRDLLAGKKSKLVTDFAAVQLSRLQPSDMAALPKWYLDHPNWRVLYMLRTFGLKQLQQLETLIVNEWKQGNKKEAIKNGMAYGLIVGGGNAALNESRQILKGNEPQLEEMPMRWADHMLGATTVNTFGAYGLRRAQQGDVSGLAASVAPAPLSMVLAPVVDIAQFGPGGTKDLDEFLEDSKTLGWLPWGNLVQDWVED